ncbi:UV radiation resistance-associated gene protein isoform X2 [Corythoichthys intestinalis]|uniref:UV radiation resistance-associated gene protein isoform X2 n=1 Tax=Corythoichthys intestinalis TaxID=161448 RepID=UPI0025A52A22|nr:UV radiation resistance-associated gene protein isoform X2 [Corythoichthys intestinalis]XP_061801722.1 UV radiation resistance-associated gene protein-like [Nerophis lumbriciformis]
MSSITGRVLAIPAASVTNSGASSSRALHVELTSQQRRLRHLRSIAARNIVNRNGSPLLDTYFTLHLCIGNRISSDFYKSEVIRDSLNPTWRSLDFGMLPDLLDTSVSCFVVRIWGGQEKQYQLLIEWKVNLDGLRYTGQQIRSRNTNEIIFGLNDGYYAADFDQKDNSERKKNSLLQVDQSSVRNSYSVFSLLRLHTAQRAIKQTQVTVQKIGKEIEEKLRTTATCTVRKKERECMRLRLAVLRSELHRQRKSLGREIDVRQKDMAQLQKKEELYAAQHEGLKDEKQSLTMLHKECTAKREQFLKFNAQLTFRCRQLLSELSYIYPINVANVSDYVICGVKLPNSEDFQAKDDGSVAVALGYTAHLVLMISCFLQIPLRYPVIHKGSRSSIKDTITDRLNEKEREFPLYPRGERFHFEYGVYLLNKNIAQLRYQHGLTTPDLQQTLPNLKNFLEHGLLVRCDRHHVSSSIPVPGKSHLGVPSASEAAYQRHTGSPDRGLRKRANSETDKYKTNPPPNFGAAVGEEPAMVTQTKQPSPPKLLSSSLDASMASLDLTEPIEAKEDGIKIEEEGGTAAEKEVHKDQTEEQTPHSTSSSSTLAKFSDDPATAGQHTGIMNGSVVPGQVTIPGPGPCCSVEQAEEIMGTEATNLGLGMGLRVGLEMAEETRLEDYRCIPVDQAVAVECDEQVLGELDVAGFEEFSRRIYALNENMSSFRRPRKNSDK